MARTLIIAACCLLLGLVAGSVLVYQAFPRVETTLKYVRPPAQPLEAYSLDEAMAVLTDRPAWTDFPPLDLPRLPTESALRGLVIVLDPGHGGADGSKDRAGPTGVREKHINLQVALMAEKLLTQAGAVVTLTRRTDVEIPLQRRSEIANTVMRPDGGAGADLFISIHHNTSPNADTNWSSVWYHRGVDQSEVALDVGLAIARRLGEEMRTQTAVTSPLLPDTNMYNTGFQVIRLSNVPAVLLESSFYTNAEEELRLGNPGYLLRQAWAIYAGLADYAYLGRPTQTVPQFKTVDGKLTFETYLLEGLPPWWGAKDRHRTLSSTVSVRLNDRPADYTFDPATRLLQVPIPSNLSTSIAMLDLRHQNMFKHSNWPQRYELSSKARRATAFGNIRALLTPQPTERPRWMTESPAPAPPRSAANASQSNTSKK